MPGFERRSVTTDDLLNSVFINSALDTFKENPLFEPMHMR